MLLFALGEGFESKDFAAWGSRSDRASQWGYVCCCGLYVTMALLNSFANQLIPKRQFYGAMLENNNAFTKN